MRLAVGLVTLVLAAPLRPQEQVDYAAPIAALADEARADAAIEMLARAGAAALPPLADALDRTLRTLAGDGDPAAVRRCVGILGALERLAEHAAGTAPLLTLAAQRLPIEHTHLVFRTLGAIIPFRGRQRIELLSFTVWPDGERPCRYGGAEIPGSAGADAAVARALQQLDRAMVRLDKGWRPNLSTVRLAQLLASGEFYAMEAALELLLRKPTAEQRTIMPLLVDVLRSTQAPRVVPRRVASADAISTLRVGAARVILACAAAEDAVERSTMLTAWRELLLHARGTGERLAAIAELRNWIGASPPAAMREFVPDLVVVLEALAPSAPPRVLTELIAVASMLGPAARSAVPVLETLAAHPERQVAQAARQALRQR